MSRTRYDHNAALASLAKQCSALGDRQSEALHRFLGIMEANAAMGKRQFTLKQIIGMLERAATKTAK